MLDQEIVEELENLRLAAIRFEQLFIGLPLPCLGFDLSGTIYEWNRASERVLACGQNTLFMSSAFTVLCSNDDQQDKLQELIEEVGRGES